MNRAKLSLPLVVFVVFAVSSIFIDYLCCNYFIDNCFFRFNNYYFDYSEKGKHMS